MTSLISMIWPFVASFIIGIMLGVAVDRFIKPILPKQIIRLGQRLRWWYFYPVRRLTPDSIYKLWLREGIMEPEAYRQFQKHGFIKDSLEPEYIIYE